jgi:hypothetical protein
MKNFKNFAKQKTFLVASSSLHKTIGQTWNAMHSYNVCLVKSPVTKIILFYMLELDHETMSNLFYTYFKSILTWYQQTWKTYFTDLLGCGTHVMVLGAIVQIDSSSRQSSTSMILRNNKFCCDVSSAINTALRFLQSQIYRLSFHILYIINIWHDSISEIENLYNSHTSHTSKWDWKSCYSCHGIGGA